MGEGDHGFFGEGVHRDGEGWVSLRSSVWVSRIVRVLGGVRGGAIRRAEGKLLVGFLSFGGHRCSVWVSTVIWVLLMGGRCVW